MSPDARPRVVVGVDFSRAGDAALEQAFAWARGCDGELHVVHVARMPFVPVGVEFGWEAPGISLTEASERLQRHVEQSLSRADLESCRDRVTLHLKVGPPAEAIVRLAAEIDADLIVIGTHGRRGVRRLLIGSVAEATIRGAGCPVLVARPKAHAHDRGADARQRPH